MSATGRLSDWKSLVDETSEDLVRTAGEIVANGDDQSPKSISKLRKLGDPDLVRLAIELARGREKLSRKIENAKPRCGAGWLTDVDGAEQATRLAVARHKSARFRDREIATVLDVACGVGVDAFALAEAGLSVTSIDRDPIRAWFCEQNAGVETLTTSAETLDAPALDVAVHIDPARRADGERRHGWSSLDPPPKVIQKFLDRDRAACVKLGPGIDPSELPKRGGELEFVEHEGELVEATWWLGPFRTTERRATDLSTGRTWFGSLDGETPTDSGGDVAGSQLLVPRPSIERAGLLDSLLVESDVPELFPGLGLATADQSPDEDAFTAFEILDVMAWREKKIVQWLRAHDGGPVEIRTRGGAVDVPPVVRALRGKGSTRHIIFGLRLGERKVAIIARG